MPASPGAGSRRGDRQRPAPAALERPALRRVRDTSDTTATDAAPLSFAPPSPPPAPAPAQGETEAAASEAFAPVELEGPPAPAAGRAAPRPWSKRRTAALCAAAALSVAGAALAAGRTGPAPTTVAGAAGRRAPACPVFDAAPALRWRHAPAGAGVVQAVQHGDAVFALEGDPASRRGARVVALEAATGSLRWSIELGSAVARRAVPAGATVVVVVDAADGVELRGLSAATGETRWISGAGAQPSGLPLVAPDGELLAFDADDSLLALDPDSGEQRWREPAAGLVFLGDELVVARPGAVRGIDTDDGAVRWSTPLDLGDDVAVSGAGDLALVTASGQLAALDRSGALRWVRRFTNDGAFNVKRLADLIVVEQRGRLDALDAATGEPRWSHLGFAATLQVHGEDDALLLADRAGLRRVDPATGEALAEQSGRRRSLGAGAGVVYAVEPGQLSAYGLERLEPRWSVPLPAEPVGGPTALTCGPGLVVQSPSAVAAFGE